MSRPTLRCAIYTRKSSEEGLEQEFNSLHAQREACEAYVKSQQHEGWRLIKTAYDDGGFSGGNVERPGPKQLLSDIQAGDVDIVVVYKVDRLTRSLGDFARIVETFEKHKVSFVSVTQSFNTTSSMGRLTLNVLLSFAQFEREVTGERIRDKVAASKKKGMWMGGCPPLGYDVRERKLQVNEPEASMVRALFGRYLELRSVRLLAEEYHRRGIKSKQWTTRKGIVRGGSDLCRGAIYTILQNRLYRGEVPYQGKIYAGEHPAIVPEALWEAAQGLLAQQRRKHVGNRQGAGNLLTGLLFDDTGNPMVPSHTGKGELRRYRYYASLAVVEGRKAEAGSLPRVSAPAIEEAVLDAIKRHESPAPGRTRGGWAAMEQAEPEERRRLLRRWVNRITLSTTAIRVDWAGGEPSLQLPICLRTRGIETRIVIPGNHSTSHRPDSALIKALGRAWMWRRALEKGSAKSIIDLTQVAGYSRHYVARILKLAYLAPDIIEAILLGRQPVDLTLARFHRIDLPLDWRAQRAVFGLPLNPNSPARQAEESHGA